jgi:hypothetical protein
MMNGQVLGDAASREQVATSPVFNELKLDPTDVAVSAELLAFLTLIGGPAVTDYDGDGKLNNEEMANVAGLVYNYLQQLQQSFAAALSGVADANQALADLNQLLELMRIENDTRQGNRQTENAEAKAALQAVERRLEAALEKLRGDQAAQGTGDIESNAQNVLSQLNAFSQTGGVTTPSGSNAAATSFSSEPSQNNGNGQGQNQPDPVGDGLRRASRLLSGMLGGGNLNILDLPPSTNSKGQAGAAGAGSPPSNESLAQQVLTAAAQGGLSALNELGTALAALGLELDPQAAAGLNAQNLSAGLQALFTLFDDLGILPPGVDLQENGPGVEDVLQQLTSILQGPENGEAGVGAVSNRSLLSFLGTLAQLGSAISAVAPQAGLTTPGQVEQASAGSLSPQSRTAEQLALVLAGLAALGSAGAGQSTGTQGSTAPSSAELRLGLQSFLAAMSAFSVFGVNQQRDQSQGQQSGITFTSNSSEAARSIAGNFATDPQLLKQLQANLNRSIQEHQSQLNLASSLFVQSQEVVQKFVSIIKQDDLARDIVHTDELSDEAQTKFDDRMTKLKQEWGVEWGSDNQERTPAGQSNLVSRAVQSGMMV